MLRLAIRAHRKRKEHYIKTLEDEVHQLRAKERRILQENEALLTEVTDLRCRVGQTDTSVWDLRDSDPWLNADVDFALGDVDACSYEGCASIPVPSWQLAPIEDSESSKSTAGSEPLSLPDGE